MIEKMEMIRELDRRNRSLQEKIDMYSRIINEFTYRIQVINAIREMILNE